MQSPFHIKFDHQQKTQGFSLTEVLIVLTIIGLIAGFAFPALQSARSKAQLSQSISILRQLQASNQLYAADHDGGYVPIQSRDQNGVLTRWVDNKDYLAYLGVEKGDPWPRNLISPKAGVLDTTGYPRYDRSYGMNKDNFTGTSTPGISWQVRAATLSKPAQTIVMADALDWAIGYSQISRYTGEEVYSGYTTACRYDGKATVAFFDGHVEVLSQQQLIDNRDLWKFSK